MTIDQKIELMKATAMGMRSSSGEAFSYLQRRFLDLNAEIETESKIQDVQYEPDFSEIMLEFARYMRDNPATRRALEAKLSAVILKGGLELKHTDEVASDFVQEIIAEFV